MLAGHHMDFDRIRVSGGAFWSGSDRHYPEESPRYVHTVAPFRIAISPVTNSDFAEFVGQTGYVTDAERNGSGLVFVRPDISSPPAKLLDCWHDVSGANWRTPDGRNKIMSKHDAHPVVQVSQKDAEAFADWAGAELPTEAQWEFAASYGMGNAEFAWGDEFTPNGRRMANVWTTGFPFTREQGAAPWGTTPVGTFPANETGAFDMIGNVWEMTREAYTTSHRASCCGPTSEGEQRVIKGGSHLCAPEYCQRYRPAARQPFDMVTTTNHIGFRLAWSNLEGKE